MDTNLYVMVLESDCILVEPAGMSEVWAQGFAADLAGNPPPTDALPPDIEPCADCPFVTGVGEASWPACGMCVVAALAAGPEAYTKD